MWIIVAAITSTLVACTVLGGLFIRYALVPYLKTQLIDPTLVQLAEVVLIANEAVKQVKIISGAWDYHLEWSQTEVDRLWKELREHQHIHKQRKGGL